MVFVLDNYDSFTFNLVQYLGELKADVLVHRNDEITIDQIKANNPSRILISPGPCTPKEAGISVELIQRMSGRLPVLGVCLGHQSICAAFGGTVSNAKSIMHGKTSMVHYEDSPLFRGMKNPFPAGRYHSLSVVRDVLPAELIVDAWTDDGEIMGMHHVEHPTYGVQFHPESVLTPSGKRLLRNFQQIVDSH